MSRLQTFSPAEGLQVSLTALKSVVSDYALRCRQAEDMTKSLMADKIPPEVFNDHIVNKLKEHIATRGLERSTQYLALIQTTVMALTSIHQKLSTTSTTELDAELITLIKALTQAANPQ